MAGLGENRSALAGLKIKLEGMRAQSFGLLNKTGGRVHRTGSANADEEIAHGQCLFNPAHLVRYFAKPHNVWA